jgi:hypothetical protein
MPFMPFCHTRDLVPGAPRPGLLGGGIWLLATWYDALPRVTPVVQTDPDGTRPRPGRCPSASGGPLAPRSLLGDGRLGRRPPAGARGERRRAPGVSPPVAVRAAGAAPGPARSVEHLPGPDGTTLHLELMAPGGAAAAGHPWLGRHQCAVVLPPPGGGGAVSASSCGIYRAWAARRALAARL